MSSLETSPSKDIPFLELRFKGDIRRVHRGIERLKELKSNISDPEVNSLISDALKAHGNEDGLGFLQVRFKRDILATKSARELLQQAAPLLLHSDHKEEIEAIIHDLR